MPTRKITTFILTFSMFLNGSLFLMGQERGGSSDADTAAIRQTIKTLVDGFASGDSAKAASVYTQNAELYVEHGPPVRGKAAIQAAYTAYFKENSGSRITLERDSVRFLSKDTAVEEGIMRVSADEKETAFHSYSILLVREGGKWQVAMVRETPAPKSSLLDLDWLIGSWKAKSGESEISSKYEWMADKSFIKCQFQVLEKGKTLHGLRIIGLDPGNGDIRIWTFETHGGVGSGVIHKDGNRWIIDSNLILPNAVEVNSSIILSKVSNNSFSWHPAKVKVNDLELPALPPIVVTRVKE